LAKTLIPKAFQPSQHTNSSLGFRVYDAHTNLSARGPTFTNLPARSPALRTSPLVVLLYEPPRS